MVASDVPVCSTMGKNILLQGGNAADAAITVALCIGSINSHSSGIGGGGIILSRSNNSTISIDAREVAPAGAYKEMYDHPEGYRYGNGSRVGGLAVAVPGELKGLYSLYKLHGSGKLGWKELIMPVVELNRRGWEVSELFGAVVEKEYREVLSKYPDLKSSWGGFILKEEKSTGGGEMEMVRVKAGDWIKRERYADTLELVANNGSHAVFYDPHGPIVKSLVKTARRFGGIITKEDFARYDDIVEEPIFVQVNNMSVYTANGISSGLALVSGLKFFDRVFDESDDELMYNHKLIESFKWLSSIRTRFGDVSKTYQNDLVKKYTADTWIDELLDSGKFSTNTTFDWKHYDPKYSIQEPHGTAHFSVVDKDNNAVSMTTTVNLLFGSKVHDPQTGIVLNNEMDDFSQPHISNAFNLTPSIYNFINPYKRPLSSMAPTIIIKDDKVDLVIGAAGGSRITTAILQAIIRLYYQNMDLLKVISYPRLHHQLIPQGIMCENVTMYNEEFATKEGSRSMRERMSELRHDFIETGALTAMNGIKRVNSVSESESGSVLEGVCDWWRKRGEADGY
ncbi:uncharacterized protein J8A68_005113 [[Candida] subhashii]|uniref:Glutathione hydrolase n=1 Tax=[Candida] subhashii TaxID=561895 RepID=A0A8J5QIJ6_9ASCO|nr:uncharacterized protein J8A68_005113 [[Candida] subhashii]KAG7661418.1 hypothetical protein J8A68_005113 [[Candida] subhashii]